MTTLRPVQSSPVQSSATLVSQSVAPHGKKLIIIPDKGAAPGTIIPKPAPGDPGGYNQRPKESRTYKPGPTAPDVGDSIDRYKRAPATTPSYNNPNPETFRKQRRQQRDPGGRNNCGC